MKSLRKELDLVGLSVVAVVLLVSAAVVLFCTVSPTFTISSSSSSQNLKPSNLESSQSAIPSSQPQSLSGLDYSTQDILVKFKPGVSEDTIGAVNASLKTQATDKIPQIGVYVIEVPQGSTPQQLVSAYQASPYVEYAELNGVATVSYDPNDPFWPEQWGPQKIEADKAYDIYKGDSSTIICILDTGIDTDHEDLKDKLIVGRDFSNDDRNDDLFGHGTHCAGIASAITDNAIGIAGVAPNVKLMTVKVLNRQGMGAWGWIAAGAVYAADNGADVLSMSLGGGSYSQAVQDALNYAYSKGCINVAARGNSYGTAPLYPACMDNVISVSATGPDDTKASFSSYGRELDIAAPGLSIFATLPNHPNYLQSRGNNYGYLSGTSMATPHVAGLAGLISSLGCSNDEVEMIIKLSADDIGEPGYDEKFGYGRINAFRALAMSADPNPPSTPTGLAVSNPQIGNTLNISWNRNTEFDIAGYNLYRSEDDVSFAKINSSLIKTNAYTDTGLVDGTTYYYKLNAVDLLDNESPQTVSVAGTPTNLPPQITMTNPISGQILSDFVSITAQAQDIGGIQRVEFLIDNVVKSTLTHPPYYFLWDTTQEIDGSHTIKVTAYDKVEASTTATCVVAVDNGYVPPPPKENWTQTGKEDFESGQGINIDTSSSPGDVKLPVGGTFTEDFTTQDYKDEAETNALWKDGNVTLSFEPKLTETPESVGHRTHDPYNWRTIRTHSDPTGSCYFDYTRSFERWYRKPWISGVWLTYGHLPAYTTIRYISQYTYDEEGNTEYLGKYPSVQSKSMHGPGSYYASQTSSALPVIHDAYNAASDKGYLVSHIRTSAQGSLDWWDLREGVYLSPPRGAGATEKIGGSWKGPIRLAIDSKGKYYLDKGPSEIIVDSQDRLHKVGPDYSSGGTGTWVYTGPYGRKELPGKAGYGGGPNGQAVSITYDSRDYPWVVYSCYEEERVQRCWWNPWLKKKLCYWTTQEKPYLRLSHWTGSEWKTEDITEGSGSYSLSLALDSKNNPYIVYSENAARSASIPNLPVKIAWWNGYQWDTKTTPLAGYAHVIGIDRRDDSITIATARFASQHSAPWGQCQNNTITFQVSTFETITGFYPAYSPSRKVQSKTVDSTPGEITKAKLTADQTVPSDTSIAYYLSANGGANWEPVTPGVDHVFSKRGSDLRWKAILSSPNGVETPSINSLSIDYGVDYSGHFISSTLDAGSVNTVYSTISWNPSSQPQGTELKFQVATNNDNSTWNFVGPDGTANTYYTNPTGQTIFRHQSGKQYLRYKAYLTTNNLALTPTLADVTISYAVDHEAPFVQITSPTPDELVHGQVEISADASDSVGIAKVEIYVDNVLKAVTISPYSYLWDSTQGQDGPHTIKAKAYDVANNTKEDTIAVVVDNSPPEGSIISPQAQTYYKGDVSIEASGKDNFKLARIELLIDEVVKSVSTGNSLSYLWNTALEKDGAHRVKLVLSDKAGNQSVKALTAPTDNTPPLTSLIAVPARPDGTNSWYRTVPKLSFATNENGKTYYEVANANASISTLVWFAYQGENITIPQGETTISYSSIDEAGNPEPVKTHQLKVDTTSPKVSITSPRAEQQVSGTVTVSANPSDNQGISKVEFYADNVLKARNAYKPYTYGLDTTKLTNGTHTIKVVAYDKASNTAYASVRVRVYNRSYNRYYSSYYYNRYSYYNRYYRSYYYNRYYYNRYNYYRYSYGRYYYGSYSYYNYYRPYYGYSSYYRPYYGYSYYNRYYYRRY